MLTFIFIIVIVCAIMFFLLQSGCYTLDGVDESYEFSRLKQSMEMVGFGTDKQRKLFCVLSAVLLLGKGNVNYLRIKEIIISTNEIKIIGCVVCHFYSKCLYAMRLQLTAYVLNLSIMTICHCME